jgi:hypothetical protein
MKSKNVTTLTRAMNHPHKISTTSTLSTDIESQLGASNSDLSRKSSGDGGGKLRRSIRALKRGSGIEAVKDLWQQTGKRLNRILLTESNNQFPNYETMNTVFPRIVSCLE